MSTLRTWIQHVDDTLSAPSLLHVQDAALMREKNLVIRAESLLKAQEKENAKARSQCRLRILKAARGEESSYPVRCAPIHPHPYSEAYLGETFAQDLKAKDYVFEQNISEGIRVNGHDYSQRCAQTVITFKKKDEK